MCSISIHVQDADDPKDFPLAYSYTPLYKDVFP